MKKTLLIILLLFSLEARAEDPATYYVPPAQFNAAVQVMDMGFSNVIGLFRTATASFAFDDATKSISNLRLALDATSIVTANSASQTDLSNLLGAFQNPEIRLTAPDSIKFEENKVEVKASLTLRGTSKPVTFEATLNKSGKSPYGGGLWASEGSAVGISMKGSFKRADFGMTDSPDTPARFGETITLMLEMHGIKQ